MESMQHADLGLERTRMPSVMVEARRRQPDGDEAAIGLWLDRAGLHRDQPGWFRACRVLGLHALCAVAAGAGALRLADGRRHALPAGDAWWLTPSLAANYGAAPGTRWTHVALVFAGPLADALARRLGAGRLVAAGAGPAVEDAFRRLLPLQGRTGAAAAAARAAALLSALSRFGADDAAGDARLAEAVAILVRHPAGAVDTAALARRVGLGASQLRRLFAARYGCAPSAWLLRLRLGRARELLAATDLPVAEVARACGFADPFWFSRVFRRESGAGPQAWRGRPAQRSNPRADAPCRGGAGRQDRREP